MPRWVATAPDCRFIRATNQLYPGLSVSIRGQKSALSGFIRVHPWPKISSIRVYPCPSVAKNQLYPRSSVFICGQKSALSESIRVHPWPKISSIRVHPSSSVAKNQLYPSSSVFIRGQKSTTSVSIRRLIPVYPSLDPAQNHPQPVLQ